MGSIRDELREIASAIDYFKHQPYMGHRKADLEPYAGQWDKGLEDTYKFMFAGAAKEDAEAKGRAAAGLIRDAIDQEHDTRADRRKPAQDAENGAVLHARMAFRGWRAYRIFTAEKDFKP